jgi:hypothetical protein
VDSVVRETWKNISPGTVWIPIEKFPGRDPVSTKILPGKVVHLTEYQRVLVEEIAPTKNPFVSGRLKRIDDLAPSDQPAKTDEELSEFLKLGVRKFKDFLVSGSEFEIRRLRDLMTLKEIGTVSQHNAINQIIEERFGKVNKTNGD